MVEVEEVVVVGSGIIGATVALALRNAGRPVLVIDDLRPEAGTPPSGGHLRPSWFGGMPKGEYVPAMDALDAAWGLKHERFVVWPARVVTTIHRVDTDQVTRFRSQVRRARVVSVDLEAPLPRVRLNDGAVLTCKNLVVAAGAWCGGLVPGLLPGKGLTAKRGVSFRVPGRLDKPFVRPWAPYKQVVAHQQSAGEVWVGDGTALLERGWDAGRDDACLERCRSALGARFAASPARPCHGLRPYAACPGGEPCLLLRPGPRVWLATGAGKLGTIAAGWCAWKILQQIRG